MISRLIIGIFLSIACFAASALELDRIIAVVDEDVVMRSELDSQMSRVREQLRRQSGAMPPTTVFAGTRASAASAAPVAVNSSVSRMAAWSPSRAIPTHRSTRV